LFAFSNHLLTVVLYKDIESFLDRNGLSHPKRKVPFPFSKGEVEKAETATSTLVWSPLNLATGKRFAISFHDRLKANITG